MFDSVRRGAVAAVVFCSVVSASPAHAGGKIVVMLGGKEVSSVPVDKLSQLTFRIESNGSFKSFYSKQWGSLNHALNLNGKVFKTGTEKPSATDGSDWRRTRIEYTGADNSWFNNSKSNPKTQTVLRQVEFYRASSEDSMLLTVQYERQYYTGKMILEGNKLTKEMAWQEAGPVLAETVIKLTPPAFANKFDQASILSTAEKDANTPSAKDQYGESFAQHVARNILYPSSSSEQKVNFTGSTLKNMKADGNVRFVWNYEDSGGEYITAYQPVAFDLHGKNSIITGQFPKPEVVEADFACTGTSVAARHAISGNEPFVFTETAIDSGLRDKCKTADGKTGTDIAATAKGPLGEVQKVLGDKSLSKEDQAKAMMRQMGMDPDHPPAEEESELDRARRQQREETGGH